MYLSKNNQTESLLYIFSCGFCFLDKDVWNFSTLRINYFLSFSLWRQLFFHNSLQRFCWIEYLCYWCVSIFFNESAQCFHWRSITSKPWNASINHRLQIQEKRGKNITQKAFSISRCYQFFRLSLAILVTVVMQICRKAFQLNLGRIESFIY